MSLPSEKEGSQCLGIKDNSLTLKRVYFEEKFNALSLFFLILLWAFQRSVSALVLEKHRAKSLSPKMCARGPCSYVLFVGVLQIRGSYSKLAKVSFY